ncbi:TPA: hypothetical protein ACN98P_004065 [Vibrio parahaemolyticus]
MNRNKEISDIQKTMRKGRRESNRRSTVPFKSRVSGIVSYAFLAWLLVFTISAEESKLVFSSAVAAIVMIVLLKKSVTSYKEYWFQ